MPSDATPTLPAIAFELGVYALAILVLVRLWRTRRTEVPLMLAAMVFAGALEISDIRTTHGYYYARFLVMIGTEPGWFPLAIAVAWGLVLHTVMTASEYLVGSRWLRPPVAAVLGVLVDLVLDPVVANARLVTSLGEICDQSGLPHGSALGLGFWVWCVPAAERALVWGIPFANFYAWGMVVLGFHAVAYVLRDLLKVDETALPEAIALAIATMFCAFCLVSVALQLYTPLVLRGVPEWLLLALTFGPGVLLLLRAGAFRVVEAVRFTSWAFPAAALLYCLGAFVLTGMAARSGLGFAAYIAAATLATAGAYAWVLLGRYPGLVRARASEASRAELLASGPAQVSPAELDQIAALGDPVLRNYMISQRYHDLSVVLARTVAGPNANWCTFATWASKTAGDSIRDEEVPHFVLDLLRADQQLHALLERWLDRSREPAHAGGLLAVVRDTLARVSSQVAAGNRKVFAELAPLFARFIECFDARHVIDDAAFERFASSLLPGATEQGGQALLRRAFSAYRNASRERDVRRRAEWMLLANCLVGLHEQTRLQANIAAAIDAPVDVASSEGLWAELSSLLPAALQKELARLLGPGGKLALRLERAIWQRIATAAAMQLDLPGGARIPLALNVNVGLGMSFPTQLRALDLPELRALLARFDDGGAGPHADGASDWASLDQRMRFIIDLFRTAQQDVGLFEQPFTTSQRLELEARCRAAVLDAAPRAKVA
jgi:hypothetical protein